MTGYDYQKFQTVAKNCEALGIALAIAGDKFKLMTKTGGTLGHFENVNDLYNYICGYEAGIAEIRALILQKQEKKE